MQTWLQCPCAVSQAQMHAGLKAIFLAVLLGAVVGVANAGMYVVQLKVLVSQSLGAIGPTSLPSLVDVKRGTKLLPPCMQGDPAVLQLPQDFKLSVSGNQRVAAVSSAAVAVEAEQSAFKAAAAKISFETQYWYKQVCLNCRVIIHQACQAPVAPKPALHMSARL